MKRPLLYLLLIILAGCGRNFGIVIEGEVYRSAQPDGEDLAELTRRYRIRSVLSLRGRKPGRDWYDEELGACRELGLRHLSAPLSARRWPRKTELLAILDAFDTGPYPMLIHCLAGADRTGLASALYRIRRGELPQDAATELSAWHYHLGAIAGTGEIDDFIDLYRRKHGGKALRRWLREDYERLSRGLPGDR